MIAPIRYTILTMPFFTRKKDGPLIPPVAPTAAQEKAMSVNSYATSTTVQDPYANSSSTLPRYAQSKDPYAASNGGGGDPYARAGPDPYSSKSNPYAQTSNQDDLVRSELFSGLKMPEQAQRQREYGYEGREKEEDFNEDEEIEGIRQEMRNVKQDSLASTMWV